MKFNLKSYKIYKFKNLLEKNHFMFITNSVNVEKKGGLKVEQNFYNLNLHYYKGSNKILVKILNNSIYKNLSNILNGPFLFIFFNKYNDNSSSKLMFLDNLKHYNIIPYCLLLKNKIYYKIHFNNLKSYKYTINIYFLNQTIYKLKTFFISKLFINSK